MNQRASTRTPDRLTSAIALVTAAGLACFALAMISIYFANRNQYASIWIVNAILLIFIFRSSATLKWYYFGIGLIATLIANFFSGAPFLAACAFAVINSVEILIPILLVRRSSNQPIYITGFDHPIRMLSLSLPLGCLLSATLATIMTTGLQWNSYSLQIAFSWFTIDLLALMAILPLGLSFTKERIIKLLTPGKLIELIAIVCTAVTVTLISADYTQIRYVIILMPLLYAAFRLGLVATCLTCFCVTSIYTYSVLTNPTFTLEIMPELISYSFLLMCITLIPGIIISILIEQRDRFDEKLTESEQRFRGAIQYSAIGMSLISPDDKWIIINPALCAITGYSENELKKMTFKVITHHDDLDRDLELKNRVRRQEIPSYTLEKRYINKEGKIVWVSVIVSAVFNQKNEFLYYVTQVEDISQRRIMEQALHESEERWKYSLEGGSQGVWDWDIANNTIYYSQTWKKMLGYEDHEVANKLEEWLSRIHPDECKMVFDNLEDHMEGMIDECHCEHRMRCKDGTYKWFLGRGKVIARNEHNKATRIIGTYTDIDTIKKTEEETEKLSQRLQMAIDAGKIGIFNYEIATNNLHWDERMFELYDVKPKEFSHNFHAWESRVHPSDYQQALNEFNQALAGTKPFDTQFRIVLSDGKIRWILAKAHVLRDINGTPIAMLGMNWDITHEKQMLHDLYTEKERLRTTLKAIGDAVIVTDEYGVITFINPIAEQLIGCSANTAIGKRLYETCKIVSELTGELLENPIDICLQKNQTHYYKEEGILINHIGSRYYIQDSAAPIILPSGEIAGCVLVLQDVTVNRNLQAELKHQATHDVLTGLINRREIELRIKSIISNTRTIKHTNSFFYIDLDNFKTVNDNAGHAAGDELLRRVAEILAANVRSTDIVARLGGDEFAVILPECTTEHALAIANNLINKIKHYQFTWDNKTYTIGASIGLITFKAKSITFEELLTRADSACYHAKNKGGNCVSTQEGLEKSH